jgi:hypothetical protein
MEPLLVLENLIVNYQVILLMDAANPSMPALMFFSALCILSSFVTSVQLVLSTVMSCGVKFLIVD